MIVYASRTGNVKYVVDILGLPSIEITDDLMITESYILFTYTDKLGEIPDKVKEFLVNNHHYIKGVICSGNSNFGINNYCKAADLISKQFNVPIIRKIEIRGFTEDYKQIKLKYHEIMKG